MPDNNGSFDSSLQHAAASDVGMRRNNNQDSYVVAIADEEKFWSQRGHLFIVADGMGAHAAGELASKLTVDTIPHLYFKHRDLPPHEALERAVAETNAEVNRRGEANVDFHNMGTTCSALTLLPQGAVIAHIGDSRIYRLRQGTLEQLTFDHSLVWEMRAAGQLEGNDLESSLPKNVITRSLGPNPTVKIDLEGPFPVQPGDCFLLCSDGLTGPVEDDELGQIMGLLPPHDAVQFLVDLSNLRGGPDNITVIIATAGQDIATTGAAPAASSGPRAMPHPAVWAGAGVCALAAAGMAFIPSLLLPAILAGVAAAACLGYAAFVIASDNGSPTHTAPTHRLGRGPHTSAKIQPTAEFAAHLKTLIDDLLELSAEQEWSFDRDGVTGLCEEATASCNANSFGKAIATRARVVMQLMQSARANRKPNGDSSIDLH